MGNEQSWVSSNNEWESTVSKGDDWATSTSSTAFTSNNQDSSWNNNDSQNSWRNSLNNNESINGWNQTDNSQSADMENMGGLKAGVESDPWNTKEGETKEETLQVTSTPNLSELETNNVNLVTDFTDNFGGQDSDGRECSCNNSSLWKKLEFTLDKLPSSAPCAFCVRNLVVVSSSGCSCGNEGFLSAGGIETLELVAPCDYCVKKYVH